MKLISILFFFIFVVTCSQAYSITLFSDNFEGDLSAWTGKNGGTHNGIIVTDHLKAGHALTFNAVNLGGDIFTKQLFHERNYILSFDYLGKKFNSGGFAGYSFNLEPQYDGIDCRWIAGTGDFYWYELEDLPDTNSWEHIEIRFSTISDIYLMFEDFVTSGPVAGDALFDNFVLTDEHGPSPVPEPSNFLLMVIGIAFIYFYVTKFKIYKIHR